MDGNCKSSKRSLDCISDFKHKDLGTKYRLKMAVLHTQRVLAAEEEDSQGVFKTNIGQLKTVAQCNIPR